MKKKQRKATGWRVYVTAKDISEGQRCKAEECPVTRAVHRATHVPHVSTGSITVQVGRWRYLLPVRAQEFVQDFDQRRPVKPFRFVLGSAARGTAPSS